MPVDIQDKGLLAQAAALAGATVAIIKHSGSSGTHKEFAALVKNLEAAASKFPNNPYVQALLTPATRQQIAGFSNEFENAPKQSTLNDFKMSALNRCAQAAKWLSEHASPEEASQVKAVIIDTCQRVAAEAKESGVFSLGGDNVNAFESSVIEELDRALHES